MRSVCIYLVLLGAAATALAAPYEANLCGINCCHCSTDLEDATTVQTTNVNEVSMTIYPLIGNCTPIAGRNVPFL